MAKGKGFKCPSCKLNRCEDNKSHFYCPNCQAVFWDFKKTVDSTGSGAGRKNKCHNCDKFTLHAITNDIKLLTVYRCSTCDAVLICHN